MARVPRGVLAAILVDLAEWRHGSGHSAVLTLMPIVNQVLALLATCLHKREVFRNLGAVGIEAVGRVFDGVDGLGAVRRPGGTEGDGFGVDVGALVFHCNRDAGVALRTALFHKLNAVSYTHLTLPTIYSV